MKLLLVWLMVSVYDEYAIDKPLGGQSVDGHRGGQSCLIQADKIRVL